MRVILMAMLICWCGVSGTMAQVYSGKSNSLQVKTIDEDVPKETAKPVVTWIYPQENTETVQKNEVNLKFGISSNTPVVKVTLMINNEVVDIFENFSSVDQGYLFDAVVEKSAQLQTGTNDVMLIVQNDLGALKHQRKIAVTSSPAMSQHHALIFAIDEYDNWEDLVGPVRDAEKIARVLESKGYHLEIVRDFTTFDLLAKLEAYVVKEFKPHDQLLIYFAGHGSVDESGEDGYFVCKNSVDMQNSSSTYISYSVIKSIVNNIPAQHIFLLMDAVKGPGEPLDRAIERLEVFESDSSNISVNEGKTRIGIMSGTSKYRQGPAYNAGSYLSRAIITYLRKQEQSRQTPWSELLKEFEQVSPTPVYIEFGDHNPSSSFIFEESRAEN